MNRLLFVRHGESEHHVNGLTGGWTDTPLTDRGVRQAEATAAHLARQCADTAARLFTSDLERASMTAAAIGRTLGIEPTADAGLRELNNGDAAGLSEPQAEQIAIPRSEPLIDWRPYPNAESWRMMADRVWSSLDRVAEATPDQVAVVVGHGNMGVVVLQWWLGLRARIGPGMHFDFAACSVSEGRINEWGERTLVRHNDTGHLR